MTASKFVWDPSDVEVDGEVAFGGPGSGWTAEKGHISHKSEKGVLRATSDRAFDGKAAEAGSTRMSKLETGQLGENLTIAYLKSQGLKDARSLNTVGNNFAVDLVGDHEVYEVKTGLATNGTSSQQWRATIGQPGPKEAERLVRMSDAAKARWNEKKAQDIMDRKDAAVKEVSERIGHKVSGKTVGLIINPVTRTVDIHIFKGFHSRIGWNSDQAKKGYRGSFKY